MSNKQGTKFLEETWYLESHCKPISSPIYRVPFFCPRITRIPANCIRAIREIRGFDEGVKTKLR
jgi:hypothetical protein